MEILPVLLPWWDMFQAGEENSISKDVSQFPFGFQLWARSGQNRSVFNRFADPPMELFRPVGFLNQVDSRFQDEAAM